MNLFKPLLCEFQQTVPVESNNNNSNNDFNYKGHLPEPLSRPRFDDALEYHCTSTIRVRYCKHKKRLLRNAQLNENVLHASRVLRILRRDVKQQEGRRVVFKVHTATKLLKYWSTFSASCKATKVSFVVWHPTRRCCCVHTHRCS